jgi:Lysine methyltransferase
VQLLAASARWQVLALLARNAEANRHLFINDTLSEGGGVARVRRFDWLADSTSCAATAFLQQGAAALASCAASSSSSSSSTSSSSSDVYAWQADELTDLRSLDYVLAADVVYDQTLTVALFNKLELLLPPPSSTTAAATKSAETCSTQQQQQQRKPVCLLALEKRFNFSLAELSVVATGYRALRECVLDLDDANAVAAAAIAAASDSTTPPFEGRRLPLSSFQQCFTGYTRTPQMELWELWRR